MKKYLYPSLLVLFVALVGLIVVFGKRKVALPFKERNQAISPASEWLNAKAAIEGLLSRIRTNPGDNKAKLNLALAYVQEGRVTGDHAHYDPAALKLLNEVLRKEPDNFEALCAKSVVYLSQHHFAEAIATANQARQISDYNAFVYGLLVDGYVELGEYPKAVAMAEKMMSIRPDIRSYARVSYLREIHGDYPGAIEAMDMAVKAGLPGLEQTAWVRTKLGELYEHTGALEKAEEQYHITLSERANYAYALAGLGRIEKARKRYTPAIRYFEQASKLVVDYAFADEMTDAYLLGNQPEAALESARSVIEELGGKEHLGSEEDGTGHYADRELAHAYLKTKELDLALKHARIEYERRPHNIDVNETLAWVHYKRGEFTEAAKYIDVARRTKSQNPVLLYRAGLIQLKNGSTDGGLALLRKALATNPYLPGTLTGEGKAYLATK
ncbi:MAG: tetratricopeptide repeat protein [Ferruginibacter sp.]|nr:tetratricopeptide repeat protein [Cytophagales bacterium]